MEKLTIKCNEMIQKESIASTKRSKINPNIMNDNGIIAKFIRSRASYRQWVRFYASTEVSKAVSQEARDIIESIKKSKFDFKKMTLLASRVKDTIDSGIIPIEKDKLNPAYDNTIYSIYVNAIKVLSDSKLSVAVNRWNDQLLKITGNGALTKEVIKENTQEIYQYAFLITAYTSIVFLVTHLTLQLAACTSELGDDVDTDILMDHYYATFHSHFAKIILKHIKVIKYFLENPVAEIEKELKVNYKTDLSKENLDYNQYLYNEVTNTHSLEFAGSILIALGVGLGLILIVPALQAIIYYWGASKIKTAQRLRDDAMFLRYNVAQLKKKLANTKSESERARLEKIIEKQEKVIEKLLIKADQIALDYSHYESDAAYIEEMDVKAEDDMHYRFDQKDETDASTSTSAKYDTSGSGSPTIFI